MNGGSHMLTTKSMLVFSFKIQGQWFSLRKSVGPWRNVHRAILRSENPAHGVGFQNLEWKEQKERRMEHGGENDMTIQKFPVCYLKKAHLFSAHQSFKGMVLKVNLLQYISLWKVLSHDFTINHVSSMGFKYECLKVEVCLLSLNLGQPHKITCNLAMPGSPVFYTCPSDSRFLSSNYFHMTLHAYSV